MTCTLFHHKTCDPPTFYDGKTCEETTFYEGIVDFFNEIVVK
jgi:hypothetical protein